MDRIEELLGSLTLDEKCALVAGRDLWNTPAVERLGVPSLRVTDGPNGARGGRFSGTTSACFPCGSALGATWDPALAAEIGAALATEARTKGAHVLLGPTVNLHRHPLAGRNFECYSEDPMLSARLAVGVVEGLQGAGVGACVKHLVANDSEHERMTISSEVDERTLRELYLAPFEAAVREGGAWAVMAAYNSLNGTRCSEHPGLLTGILREEWGFDGLVMSDWFGTRSTVGSALAGLDLEMPGPPASYGPHLAAAVRDGEVEQMVVDGKVRRLLHLLERTGGLSGEGGGEERSIDDPAVSAVIRRAAIEGTVLLRNEGGLLPLDPSALRTLAMIGPNAVTPAVHGGGSASVTAHHLVTPLAGLAARLGAAVDVVHEIGTTNHRSVPPVPAERLVGAARRVEVYAGARLDDIGLDGAGLDATGPDEVEDRSGASARFYDVWLGAPLAGDGPWTSVTEARFVADVGGEWTFSLVSVGRSRLLLDGECVVDNTAPQPGDSFFGLGSAEASATASLAAGEERVLRVEYENPGLPLGGYTAGALAPVPADAFDRAVAAAAAADTAVVVVGTTPDWETEGRDRRSLELPGEQAALVRAVAAAQPRTVVVVNAGAPVDMTWADEVPAVLWCGLPGQEFGAALADVLFGDADPGGRLPTTLPRRLEDTPAFTAYPGERGQVRYAEGLFVGHRWYDARGIEPAFAFGAGGSYTTFEFGPVTLSATEVRAREPLAVRVPVTNTGGRAGVEVVQCYVAARGHRELVRPPQWLAGFAKVRLDPGETVDAEVTIAPRAFEVWDPARAGWWAELGEYEVRVARSSREVVATATVTLAPA